MNKQQMLEQIDELKQKIEELEKEITSPEFEGIKKGGRQMPKKYENYYYVGSDGHIYSADWIGNDDDLFRFNTGNCFKTEQEAIDFKENILTKQQLKDLALELNNGVEIDWEDEEQFKCYLNCDSFGLSGGSTFSYADLGQIYCLDNQFLTIAKERIGEEKLIKLIKSGV